MRYLWLALLVLSGCGNTYTVEPVTDLGERRCEAEPSLAGATPLGGDPPGRTATVDVDVGAACVRRAGEAAGLYVVFALPEKRANTTLSVTSVIAGRALLAPRLTLFQGDGKVTRAFEADQFMFRGTGLSTMVRLRPEERFAVVGSTPAMAGQAVDRINNNFRVLTVPIGIGVMFVPQGSESTQQMRFSHNGRVLVEAREAIEVTVPR